MSIQKKVLFCSKLRFFLNKDLIPGERTARQRRDKTQFLLKRTIKTFDAQIRLNRQSSRQYLNHPKRQRQHCRHLTSPSQTETAWIIFRIITFIIQHTLKIFITNLFISKISIYAFETLLERAQRKVITKQLLPLNSNFLILSCFKQKYRRVDVSHKKKYVKP